MTFRKFIACFFVILSVAGCGVRGNLYLPDDPTHGKGTEHNKSQTIYDVNKDKKEK